tara:strand:- start:2561 stop:2719 length:159 start_codon:yes stop_codon:yes gene_type:complete
MPFKSEAQRRWMHKKYPAMAKRWEEHTPKGKLPAKARQQAAKDQLERKKPSL